MGKRGVKDLTSAKREEIVSMVAAGVSYRNIARHLNIAVGTVARWSNRKQRTGDVVTLPRSGQPRVTTADQDRAIEACVEKNGFTTSLQIKRKIGVECSTQTLRRRLHAANFKCFTSMRKPALSGHIRGHRLAYAREYLQLNDEEWHHTISMDEKTYAYNQAGHITLWKVPGSGNTEAKRKSIAYDRPSELSTANASGDLVFINEQQQAEDHIQNLADVM